MSCKGRMYRPPGFKHSRTNNSKHIYIRPKLLGSALSTFLLHFAVDLCAKILWMQGKKAVYQRMYLTCASFTLVYMFCQYELYCDILCVLCMPCIHIYIYMDIYETSCKRWTKWWIWTLNGIVNMLRFMMLYVLYMCWLVRAEGQQRFQCLLSSRSGRRIMQSCWKRKASLQSQIATLVLRCLYIYRNVVCGSMDAYLKTAEGVYDVFNLVKTNCIQIAVEGFLILAFILTSPRNFRTIHES